MKTTWIIMFHCTAGAALSGQVTVAAVTENDARTVFWAMFCDPGDIHIVSVNEQRKTT